MRAARGHRRDAVRVGFFELRRIFHRHAEIAYAAEFFRWFSEEAVRIAGSFGTAPAGGSRLIERKQRTDLDSKRHRSILATGHDGSGRFEPVAKLVAHSLVNRRR